MLKKFLPYYMWKSLRFTQTTRISPIKERSVVNVCTDRDYLLKNTESRSNISQGNKMWLLMPYPGYQPNLLQYKAYHKKTRQLMKILNALLISNPTKRATKGQHHRGRNHPRSYKITNFNKTRKKENYSTKTNTKSNHLMVSCKLTPSRTDKNPLDHPGTFWLAWHE